MITEPVENKVQLRRRMRRARRSLSVYKQRLAAIELARLLGRCPELRRAQRIGIYWPVNGEIDPRLLLYYFPSKQFYLPVLPQPPQLQLSFCRWRGRVPSYRNPFGIPEPLLDRYRPQLLDLVLLPLVAFDRSGARLGMGAGFYDRTFAYKQLLPGVGPQLIGVAHQLQLTEQLPVDSWDIPLNAVATDCRLYRCR
ncbi:MAG: 5-formyltetrahydrofolate cyclo-ligase [Gammaproteobacteria bacterium]|nr:5-formyltetrahydrofolate cyclo-ligase [Gammaproteobacteria bacterium]